MAGGCKKEYRLLAGVPVLARAILPFVATGRFSSFVVVVPPSRIAETREILAGHLDTSRLHFVEGGGTRPQSVYRGLLELESLSPQPDNVLIHDGARPWIDEETILRVLEGTEKEGACLPVIHPCDAVKVVNEKGFVMEHLEKGRVFGAQTPQGFSFSKILDAHRRASSSGRLFVDDGEVWAGYVCPVYTVPGNPENRKVTFAHDLQKTGGGAREAAETDRTAPTVRVGTGFDLHRLAAGRRLMIGGCEIPSEVGELAHSDGDVLLHAVIDALLGAAALADIGAHFPPEDPAWKDAASRDLLSRALRMVQGAGLRPVNLDCTVVLERPKLRPHVEAIRTRLAGDLGLEPGRVSVKAKTAEGLGPVGEGRAVEAHATVLVQAARPT